MKRKSTSGFAIGQMSLPKIWYLPTVQSKTSDGGQEQEECTYLRTLK